MNLGVRTSPTEVTFCVFDPQEQNIKNISSIVVPKALTPPEQLKHIRLHILDILREYKVTHAGIRTLEATAQSVTISRVQIEGVIQEAFASSDIQSYYVGQISNISAKVGIPRTDFKLLVDGSKTLEGFEGWDDLSKEEREAALCAMGASNV